MSDRMPRGPSVARRVPPRHCDAQGMLHASRPAEYFEDAFLQWLEAACGGYRTLVAAGVDLVIVESTTRYLAPARLDDVVVATATPVRRGHRSIVVGFELARDDEVLVSATIAYVAVDAEGPVAIPHLLEAALHGVPSREPG